MPQSFKQFSGFMNTDDSDEVIPSIHHRIGYNGRFRGNGSNRRFEGVEGTTLLPNNYLPAIGNNECNGAIFDNIKQRVIWFNQNTEGYDAVFVLDLKTKIINYYLLSFTNSTTNILNFDLNYPIASINIIYATDDIGDTLCWTDRNNRPQKLNLKQATDNIYGSDWSSDFLTVARQPPLISPSCRYMNDSTVTINNLRKTLYEFRYRYIYRDSTKSTYSPYSKLFAPLNPDSLAVDKDGTKNNRIDVTIQTGHADCISIEITARLVIGTNVFSDCFLVATLKKSELIIGDNTIYTYQFFNDAAYPYVDIVENIELFDYVPRKSNAQELLNGNVIAYGGITEGVTMDVTLDIDVTITTFLNANSNPITILAYPHSRSFVFMFQGQPNAGDQIDLYITLNYADGSPSVNYMYHYLVLSGDDAQDVADAFVALINGSSDDVNAADYADSNGTTGIQITGDDAFNVVRGQTPAYEITYFDTPTTDDVNIAAYLNDCRYRFAILYKNEFGVTPGGITTDNLLVTIPEVDTTGGTQMKIANIELTINNQPPLEATSYSILRAPNQSVLSVTTIISATTEKDSTSNYAYLEITNLNTNQNGYNSYTFSDGDRIRILGEFVNTAAGTVNSLDYPISTVVVAPTINGVAKTGTYVKVLYDTALTDFGTKQHYYCQIYTPAINTDSKAQLFYEIGETYQILFPGTVDRAHQGKKQDQIVGTQPAIIDLARGDVYIRTRKFPITADLVTVNTMWLLIQSVSDLYPSTIEGVGSGYPLATEFDVETYYQTLLRWSLAYQQNTNINQTNRFYPLNLDEIDRQKGDIQRLMIEERLLYVYQNRAVGQFGVYARFIQNNDGTPELVTTDSIITTNNINYLEGNFGLGDQYCSLVRSAKAHYFSDPVFGANIARYGNGLDNLSKKHKGQFTINKLITPYNKTWTRTNGSKAKILGFYDTFEEEYHCILQAGINNGEAIDDYNFSFNESPERNSYSNFFNYHPEWVINANNLIYSWKNGQLYEHSNTEQYCNFYNEQFYPSIQLIFNEQEAINKNFNAIAYQSNQIWTAPNKGDIYTNLVNPQTGLKQESSLPLWAFKIQEGKRIASFLRDINSMVDPRQALNEGDFLQGFNLGINLVYLGTEYSWIYLPYLTWELNNRQV